MEAAVIVALPTSNATGWGQDLLKLLATSVGLPDDAAITVKIRYGDNNEEEELNLLKGGRKDWKALSTADPTDILIVVEPPPAPPPAPIICYCGHADCAGAPPGFEKIAEMEEHYFENHNGVCSEVGDEEVVKAIFRCKEDAMTPAWRRKDKDCFENKQIRWEQVAHIAKAIIPVRKLLQLIPPRTSFALF